MNDDSYLLTGNQELNMCITMMAAGGFTIIISFFGGYAIRKGHLCRLRLVSATAWLPCRKGIFDNTANGYSPPTLERFLDNLKFLIFLKFIGLLSLAALFVLSSCLTAFVYEFLIEDDTQAQMLISIDDYATNQEVHKEWDNVQRKVTFLFFIWLAS